MQLLSGLLGIAKLYYFSYCEIKLLITTCLPKIPFKSKKHQNIYILVPQKFGKDVTFVLWQKSLTILYNYCIFINLYGQSLLSTLSCSFIVVYHVFLTLQNMLLSDLTLRFDSHVYFDWLVIENLGVFWSRTLSYWDQCCLTFFFSCIWIPPHRFAHRVSLILVNPIFHPPLY